MSTIDRRKSSPSPRTASSAAGIAAPFGEKFGELLVIPSEEEVSEFVVVDGIGVGRVGDPEVAGLAEVAGVTGLNFTPRAIEGLIG